MNLNIKLFTGEILNINIENNDILIIDIKQKIYEKYNLSILSQHLVIKGVELENDKKLTDYQLKEKVPIYLISKEYNKIYD